jgi:hypothetical protein
MGISVDNLPLELQAGDLVTHDAEADGQNHPHAPAREP